MPRIAANEEASYRNFRDLNTSPSEIGVSNSTAFHTINIGMFALT